MARDLVCHHGESSLYGGYFLVSAQLVLCAVRWRHYEVKFEVFAAYEVKFRFLPRDAMLARY